MMTRLLFLLVCAGIADQTSLGRAQTFTNAASTVLPGVDVSARSASLADIDNDGDLDLMFQTESSLRLYRNNVVGNGTTTFSNISSLLPTGVNSAGNAWSAAWGDYNGDGLIDVFVGRTNPSSDFGAVLTNRGAAGFTNDSVATGLVDRGFHQNVAWADIDRDRDLDLLIAQEGPSERHEIYLQDPAGTFSPVGNAVGFQQFLGIKAYGMAIGDTDGDGDLDVYISTCHVLGGLPNNFYQNMLVENGDLGFVDIANFNGTQLTSNSYGAEFHDFDDDGDLDLLVTGADREPSKIFRNDGGNQFTDVDALTGRALLSDTGGDLNGSRALDYDNDGDLDLFFHDHLAGLTNSSRKLYRNDGGWTFTDVTMSEGLHEANLGSYDSTWGDLDLDGDLDLVATTEGGTERNPKPERVFLSSAAENGNHWLYVRLEGLSDNTSGVGASVYATINQGAPEERTLRREANTNAGTFNQSDLPVHFGLGVADVVDELEVRWPDGTIQTFHDIAANQYITIRTPGDFNGDGQVDGEDLAVWQAGFGNSALGDWDLDGDADGADLLAWQRHLGNGVRPAATGINAPVPEPASYLLLCLAFACLGWRHAFP